MPNEKSKKEFTYKWTIQNFSRCTLRNGEYLTSPSFVTEVFGKRQWCLKLYPRGETKNSEKYAICILHRNDIKENDSYMIDFELTLMSSDGEICRGKTESVFSVRNVELGWYMILTEELLSALKISGQDALTVSCHMIKSAAKSNPASGCIAMTNIIQNHCSFQWNFRIPAIESWIDIREFPFPDICKMQIALAFEKGLVDVIVSFQNLEETYDFFSCKIVLLNAHGSEYFSRTQTSKMKPDDAEWRFLSFIKKSELQNEKENLLKNGIFTLKFYFSASRGEDHKEIIEYIYDSDSKTQNRTTSTLGNDLCELLNNKMHSDVQLQVDGQTFYAHKSILSARSHVFRAMFNRDMKEKETGIVDITDIAADTMKHFLNFLYTDALGDLDYDTAVRLLVAADKYAVPHLTEKCSSFLKSVLSVNNACEILLNADMVREVTLKFFVIEYMSRNFAEILLSPEWMELTQENCKLGSEVLQNISAKLGTFAKNKGDNSLNTLRQF